LNQTLSDKEKLEKELAAVKLRLSQYELASDGASEGLWDRDLITDKVFISPPWATMLGYEPEEIQEVKGVWENLIHEDDKTRAIRNFEDYIDGKIARYDIDFRFKHKKGHYIWVRSKAKLVRNTQGKAIRISGSHTDITSKKEAAEKLTKSEKKYKYLFEHALIGMMRVKADDFLVTELNHRGLQILAMPEQSPFMCLNDLFAEKEQMEEVMRILHRNKGLDEQEIKIIRWDESITWISVSAVFYEDNNDGFYDIIFKDVSEFKENLIELQRLNFELDNFVYHASHDIRSPLRSMMGLVEILKTESNPIEVRKIVDMMSGSINRLDTFVVDLLAMSRNNRVQTEAVKINLMVELNNSITNFHHVYNTRGLEIRTSVSHAIPFYSDLTKVRIILNNLISNAIKYRRIEKGLVSFIHISVEITKEEGILTINDNGEGISADKLDKIFDMFYRASENSEGSGLGMYIVKNVIKKLDASIDVKSEEKKGTNFVISIPNRLQDQ
jgi:PAS domain S-box-containing protein